MPKTAFKLRLPSKAKPIKLLPKRAPSNTEGVEQTAGALHIDPKNDVFELHVTDGNRSAIIQLEREELPDQSDDPQVLVSGQLPAPAIKLMQGGASVEMATKTEVVAYDDSNEAEVTYHRDQQLVDEPQDVSHTIPDITLVGVKASDEICIDAKRLKEMSEAFGSDKLILTTFGAGEPLHVRPINGPHVGSFKQAERPRPKSDPEPEATETLVED